jgi:hypothetical protein
MINKRHLLLGGVGIVKGKIRNDGAAMVAVCDTLEPFLSGCFSDVSFDTISVTIRYSAETIDEVEIGRIDKTHRELPVAVQVAISDLQAIQSEPEVLQSAFQNQALKALSAVAEKFDLLRLREMLNHFT